MMIGSAREIGTLCPSAREIDGLYYFDEDFLKSRQAQTALLLAV